MTKEQLQDAFAKVASEFQNETGFRVDRVDFTYFEQAGSESGRMVRTSRLIEAKVEVQ